MKKIRMAFFALAAFALLATSTGCGGGGGGGSDDDDTPVAESGSTGGSGAESGASTGSGSGSGSSESGSGNTSAGSSSGSGTSESGSGNSSSGAGNESTGGSGSGSGSSESGSGNTSSGTGNESTGGSGTGSGSSESGSGNTSSGTGNESTGGSGTGSGSSESGSGNTSSGTGNESTGGTGTGSGSSESGSGNGSAGGCSISASSLTVTGAIEGSQVFIEGRTVEIWARWCSDHEVTQSEYERYCSYGEDESPSDTYGIGSNYPAYFVSWYDALVYCNRRSIAEHLTPCYTINNSTNPDDWGSVPKSSSSKWNAVTCDFTANGYRLPTEAEWEYFARGGNTSNSNQTIYSGSDTIDVVAWHPGNSDGKVHEVKTKAPNALGLYDMSGNVWEWCWDRRWAYEIHTSTPSAGGLSGSIRVRRGGSRGNLSDNCPVANLGVETSPFHRTYDLGFRVVRSSSN